MNNLNTILRAAIDAGKLILDIYQTDFKVEYKKDESPLTVADRKANDLIEQRLMPTGIPVLSEEGKKTPFEERKTWKKLWIVDPLDGTKEFIKKNGEFTVNIALVHQGRVVSGVVYAPVLDLLYVGTGEIGAFRIENASRVSDFTKVFIDSNRIPKNKNKKSFGVVASRSHLTGETEEFIEKLKELHPDIEIVSKGSSLKLCMIAEGSAEVYPRFAPTSEWDTAAGHAVVKAAGGNVFDYDRPGEELSYNKQNVLNPWFIALGKPDQIESYFQFIHS